VGVVERVQRDWYSWQIAEAKKPSAVAARRAPAVRTTLPERTGFLPSGPVNETYASMGEATGTDRKSTLQELWQAYLTCPWSWTCVQVIARTITAGGLVSDWDSDDSEGDQKAPDKPPAVVALERFYGFCNPTQDIRQLLRNLIADLLVFGDAYLEVVWSGSQPIALYNLDCPTTTPVADEHGQVSKYVQVTDYGKRAEFEPREVIHFSLDSARPGVFGVSPTHAAMTPITIWLFAAATEKEMLRKGLPPALHADFPAGKSETELEKWRNQAAAQNLGARNIGVPWITRGGATLTEFQTGKLSDVLDAKQSARDEILAEYGVPPAEAMVIESGNLGGGTGDSQHRSFELNTCQPLGEIVLEKLNFHIAKNGFGVEDWHSKFGDVDYRDSMTIEQIRDTRLRDGAYSLNRYRAEIGEPPVTGGDDAFVVNRQNMVLVSDLKAMSAATVAAAGGPASPMSIGQPAGPAPDDQDDQDPDGEKPGDDAPQPAAKGGKGAGKKAAPEGAYRAMLAESFRRAFSER
jgi:Phage portal protein